MSDDKPGRRVPSNRLSRMGRLGGLAGRIATNVITEGSVKWLKGERPKLRSLLLTPANLNRLADQLATLRGAAMKLGQLISMDAGDVLPKELADILARLRDDATPMPKAQLQQVLDDAWGIGWKDRLLYFSYAPVAAASIGQVHKAITMDGETLAIKVQYPGVAQSIDSDVDNVASLIRMTGLIPPSLDTAPLLNEAKIQLHQEADYQREAQMLTTYARNLAEDARFRCPAVHDDWSTASVLAMDFMPGADIESLIDAPQATRDEVMTALLSLFFKEVFEFRLIQSDPNLANYRYDADTRTIVLLDFGATRALSSDIADGYRNLLKAASEHDVEAMLKAAFSISLLTPEHSEEQQQAVIEMGMTACEAARYDGQYDFGNSDLIPRLQDMGWYLTKNLNFWHLPPADALLIHRKLGGLFLLAKRLKARVDMRKAAAPWLS